MCDPIDGSPPGSPVPGILQARALERVSISFSKARKWKVKLKSLSRVRLSATSWTAAHQAPLSMGFSRQEYWSGLPLPSLRDVLQHLKMNEVYFFFKLQFGLRKKILQCWACSKATINWIEALAILMGRACTLELPTSSFSYFDTSFISHWFTVTCISLQTV